MIVITIAGRAWAGARAVNLFHAAPVSLRDGPAAEKKLLLRVISLRLRAPLSQVPAAHNPPRPLLLCNLANKAHPQARSLYLRFCPGRHEFSFPAGSELPPACAQWQLNVSGQSLGGPEVWRDQCGQVRTQHRRSSGPVCATAYSPVLSSHDYPC